uniref:Uncharacterized protein n=1 Tax=Heterorhabditis bacteriophora TaxID=37862 RepID=A0A1I7WQ46_HETBA
MRFFKIKLCILGGLTNKKVDFTENKSTTVPKRNIEIRIDH